jgi:hypothetical protein
MHPRIFTALLIIVAFLILAFLGIKNAKGDITDILLMEERPTSGIIFYQRGSQPAQSLIYFRNQNIITIYDSYEPKRIQSRENNHRLFRTFETY